MKLWLVRHAPVVAAPGLCYGASDLVADAAATRAAALTLARQLPNGLTTRVSPLQRCEQLWQAVKALRPDLMQETDARLRELDFGAWEGRSWGDIDRAEFECWLADFVDTPPAIGGESVRLLMARVAGAWDEWRASGSDRIWITHAGVIRAALLLSRGVRRPASAADWPSEALAYGQVRAIDMD